MVDSLGLGWSRRLCPGPRVPQPSGCVYSVQKQFKQLLRGAVAELSAGPSVQLVSSGEDTTITRRMVGELIDHIDVYHAEKRDGVTNQRVVIHYNCIGAFDVPDRRKIPEADIIMETRKGVALSYAPAQIAV